MLAILRGTVMGQIIMFASLPLLSRIFSPDSFGTFQSMQSVLSLLLIICSLRLEIAILSTNEDELPHLITACTALCLLTSLITLLVVSILWLFFRQTISQWGAASFLIPSSLLVAGLGQILSYLSLRLQAFGITATAKIVQSVIYSTSALIMGILLRSTLGLMVADVLGRIALVFSSLRGAILATLCHPPAISHATWRAMRSNMNYPLFSMPSAVINVLGSSFTSVMLLTLFSAKEAGNYAMVERMIGAPVAVLAGAASQAFMAALSQQSDDPREKRTLFLRIIKMNALLGALPVLFLAAAAPSLAPGLLGAKWATAGTYARILAPMLYMSFLATPVNMTLVLCGRQAWQLGWDLARLIVMAILWWIVGTGGFDARLAVSAFSAIATLFYLIHIALSYSALGRVAQSGNRA